MSGMEGQQRLSSSHSAFLHEAPFADGAATGRRATAPSTLGDISYARLASFPVKDEEPVPSAAPTPAAPFKLPTLIRESCAEGCTSAPRRNLASPTLLSDVLRHPLLQLVPPTYPATTSAAAASRQAINRRESHVVSFLSPSGLSSDHGTDTPPFLSQTATGLRREPEGASTMPMDPPEIAPVLPSSRVPPPSMLLVALADMDLLQQSLYTHTCLWPAKEQVSEFKKHVAASMKAELSHEVPTEEKSSAKDALHDRSAGMSRPFSGADTEHESMEGESRTARVAVGALQAHDAAVRAALHRAHGFLHGAEAVPTGVPSVHLQRARMRWVRQYRSAYVRPWLENAQRCLYEVWCLEQQQQQSQQSFPANCSIIRSGDGAPRSSVSCAQRGGSVFFAPAVAPATTCAALKPPYWHTGPVEGTAPDAAQASSPAARAVRSGGGGMLLDAAGRRQGFLRASTALADEADEVTIAAMAAWEMDLFDDLQLVVTAQLTRATTDQGTTRSAVEAAQLRCPPQSSAATILPVAALASDAAVANVLQRPADLTQMQLPLPTFVYVMSRYLFLAHYAAHFPAGLFSSALINPFYFPEAAQCTAAYALRAAPALRREAEAVRASYAAQLADAHRCFPDRVPYMEVPLPRHDAMHLYELLCPPQRQDRVGRWQPVPWGHLLPDEEDTLLQAEYAIHRPGGSGGAVAGHAAADVAPPLLSFAYARAARRVYRDRLQRLAQHPLLLEEVIRLLSVCEEVAMRFFAAVDTEQRGCITWEDFTNALIEEADVEDHQLKVREHAAQLTRTSASVFDRYVVEPLTPTLTRLGYTGDAFEVRHSTSLVMLEGPTDYAVCDGTQLGSIHQRFLVRPVEVVLKELEAVPRDAFGRPLRSAGVFTDSDGGVDEDARGGGTVGYDAALRLHPWRNNQQPVRIFTRYEDGRRLQESTALSVLRQLSGNGPSDNAAGAGDNDGDDAAAGHRGVSRDGGAATTPARMHQPAKPVALQAVMAVEGVSPYVPWTVFVALSNDMLLRLYSSNRAVQALPEAGLLRCSETVTCMEWAAGGSHGRAKPLVRDPPAATVTAERRPSSAPSSTMPSSRSLSRLSIQRQEYLLLGTRSGVVCLIDLYAVLHKVPRLTTTPSTTAAVPHASVQAKHGPSSSDGGHGNNNNVQNEGMATSGGGDGRTGKFTAERIGSSNNAWSGYRALAQRTYYNDIVPFVLHRRQVHAPGTLVSSVLAAAADGLFVSSGLDGDVFTMRLGYPADASTATHATHAARAGVTTVHSDGTTTSIAARPLLCIEVLQRLTVSDTGVRRALPIPSLSLLAVLTVSNKVFLYHTSVLPTATPLTDGGWAESGKGATSSLSPSSSSAAAAGVASVASRLELYDAAAPHLGAVVAVVAVEELDQLLTVDSTGYVKVWSLRQSQLLTSFYAVAPVQTTGMYDTLAEQGGPGDGRIGGTATRRMASASGQRSSSHGVTNDGEGKGLVSALLRTTKQSIEAAVEAAESRLQPCLSAAYNYAGRQLYVMGSNNAALCFFMSGQSSARAHTNALRVLLIDTASKSRGQLHRRLITLSSADCRTWSLLTGAMELGIRASNSEYRQLFDHRLTGRPETALRQSSAEASSSGGDGAGRGGRGGAARLRGGRDTQDALAVSVTLTTAASTTGKACPLLPPSVEDVMRAVLARPGSTRARSRVLRARTLARGLRKPVSRSGSAGVPTKANPQAKQTVSAAGTSRDIPLAATFPSSGAGLRASEGDDANLLLPGALRDHNAVTSDIRCACLGPEGQWIGYALQHGEIRLHRSDSGRLLHTFITTPPSMAELVHAALHYEHLFMLTPATSTPAASAALAAPPTTRETSPHVSASPSVPTPQSTVMPSFPRSGAATGTTPSTAAAAATPKTPRAPPPSKLTPVVYAQAVADVLQRLLTPVKAGQRFASFSTTSRGGALLSASGAVNGSSGDGADALDSGGSRDVHCEPLSMFYVEAAQELLVVYADGLVRAFTLLGHRTTATRVIVSRTLVNRALEQVRQVLRRQLFPSPHQHQQLHLSLSQTTTHTENRARAEASVSQLQVSSVLTSASLQDLITSGAIPSVALTDGDGSTSQRRGRGDAAFLPPHRRRASSLLADAVSVSEVVPNTSGALVGAPLTTPQQLEPDVVLLATASLPLGLICLVHASGLVTVMDVQARRDSSVGGLGGPAGDERDGLDASFVVGAATATATATAAASGTGGVGDFHRSQAGVVVHSFVTADEVTAATFLGAYPCLVLADRQRVLSFYLVKGSSMLAVLGDFAKRLQRDAAELLGGAAVKPCVGGALGSVKASSSSTRVWTTSIDSTCASVHVLGSVTVLTFDPLYATLYVGTSQGYIMSYLVRRLLLAFQLTPVPLQGEDGVAITTYAAELQRSVSRRPLTPRDVSPDAGDAREESATFHYVLNLLKVFFAIPPLKVREQQLGSQVPGGGVAAETPALPYDPNSSALVRFYEMHKELFRPTRELTAESASPAGALLTALQRSPARFFTAAAVLHDAVTRMSITATVRGEGGGDPCSHSHSNNANSNTARPVNSSNNKRNSSSSPSPKGRGVRPWWDGTVGGTLVKEYVVRQCGSVGDGPVLTAVEDAGTAATALASTELDLDQRGVELLREWVCAALTAEADTDGSLLPGDRFPAGAAAPLQGRRGSLDDRNASATLPPPSQSSSPTRHPGTATLTTTPTAACMRPRSPMTCPARERVEAPPSPSSISPRTLADTLVQEVEEELLFGDTATAFHEKQLHPASMCAGDATLQGGGRAGYVGHAAVMAAWVEPLFTRHAVAMASRSPLCLLTPPAMLERSRRERLDRQARRGTTTTTTATAASSPVEWDHYVEGAPPDYLADMLSRPGQVLPEAERQALRQRAITALQCRRNGYLCVGHADGGVTLWTPYACGRLASLCPTTSLPTSLERLSQSVLAQFQYAHERVVLERQRLAFEGAARNVNRSEEEEKAHMKHRIRKLLLDHHLSQLHSDDSAGAGGDADPRSSRDLGEIKKMSLVTAQPLAGVWEGELMRMLPLLCLLLGIASSTELQARQLALEDMCFLPLRMDSIASLEEFRVECYAAAVAVAVQRLRRELVEADDASAQGVATTTGVGCGETERAAPRLLPTDSPQLSRPAPLSLERTQHVSLDCGVRCVYDYPISFLTRVLQEPFDPHSSPGLMAFPGAVRLLLHRAMEGAPLGSGSGQVGRVSLRHVPTTAASTALPSACCATEVNVGAAAEATASAEGEYYEVCHALQLAETHAETQWETAELHGLWTRRQSVEVPLPGRRSPGDGVAHRRGHGRPFPDGDDSVDNSVAALPPSSAAAVLEAVRRQLLRELEGRLAALSQRAAAGVALLHVRLQQRLTEGGASPTPQRPGTHDDTESFRSTSSGGHWYAALTRGSGLAWVQATLRQQSRFTFTEPQLILPTIVATRPPSAFMNTSSKVRVSAEVREARLRPPSSPTVRGTTTTPSSLSSSLHAEALALISPAPLVTLTPLASTAASLPPVAQPGVPVMQVCSTRTADEAAGTRAGRGGGRNHHSGAAAVTPLHMSSEASLLDKSATVPAVFLTEMSTGLLSDDLASMQEDGVVVSTVGLQAGEQGRERRAGCWTPPLGTPTVATTLFSQARLPPHHSLSSAPSPRVIRGLPLVPLHRTKLARTGSSQPSRRRPAGAVGAAGSCATWLPSSPGYAADGHGGLAVGGDRDVQPPRLKMSASHAKAVKRKPSPTPSYTCYSLLERFGTTK